MENHPKPWVITLIIIVVVVVVAIIIGIMFLWLKLTKSSRNQPGPEELQMPAGAQIGEPNVVAQDVVVVIEREQPNDDDESGMFHERLQPTRQ